MVMKCLFLILVCLVLVIVATTSSAAITIEEALKTNTEELMSIPGVVGIGQGLCDGARCIKVLVIERTPEIEKRIPDTLEGYRVEIDVTGRIRAQ